MTIHNKDQNGHKFVYAGPAVNSKSHRFECLECGSSIWSDSASFISNKSYHAVKGKLLSCDETKTKEFLSS
jgi:hypothetical protein